MQNDSPDAGNMISVTWWEKILCYYFNKVIYNFSTNFLGPLSWEASHEGEMHDARESDYGDIMYKRSSPKPSYAASGTFSN